MESKQHDFICKHCGELNTADVLFNETVLDKPKADVNLSLKSKAAAELKTKGESILELL
jgi:hypothetical protein